MCKHVAATLYGVGARLDQAPEMLFTLRGVDPAEMIEAAIDRPQAASKPRKSRVLESGDLSSVFGVDIDTAGIRDEEKSLPAKPARRRLRAGKKRAWKKPAMKAVGAKKAGRPKKAGRKKGGKKGRKKAPSQKSARRRKTSKR